MDIGSDFEWAVYSDGYTIIDKVLLHPMGGEKLTYWPMRNHSGLFLAFSELEATDDAILDFANQYGLLIEEKDDDLSIWPEAIHAMKTAVGLWQSGNENEQGFLDLLINKFIEGNIQPHFARFTTPKLQFRPDTLYTALWLQLALAINDNKTFRYCAWCGTPFELSPTTARTNRLFCSNSCKQAEYRERKAQVETAKSETAKKRASELEIRKVMMPSDADIDIAIKTAEKHCKYMAGVGESF
jgi:endogenous inhibitor of DNA gyrase (YacG/DUF329 family)